MNTEARSRANAPHYVWKDVCDGWHLVQRDGLSVIEERMPPGTSEEAHRHLRSRQFFYVLDGEAVMRLADRSVRLAPGHGIEIEPGLPHQMRNDSDHDVRFLVISSPPAHRDRQTVELSL